MPMDKKSYSKFYIRKRHNSAYKRRGLAILQHEQGIDVQTSMPIQLLYQIIRAHHWNNKHQVFPIS